LPTLLSNVVTITDDPTNQKLTFTVSTTNAATIGTYFVEIKAYLDTSTTTAWTGTKPENTWS